VPDAGDDVRDRDARQASALKEGTIPEAGDRIPFNGIGDHQFPRGCNLTIGDGDLAASRGVSQVAEVSSVERQERTGKERKKGLERFHDAPALSHARRQGKQSRIPARSRSYPRPMTHILSHYLFQHPF